MNKLVVSTHLKNIISQIGSFPQIGVKIKNIWNHHLVKLAPFLLSKLKWFNKPIVQLRIEDSRQISGACAVRIQGVRLVTIDHRLQNPATKNWAQKNQLQVGVHNSTYRGVITYNPTETYLFIFGHFDPENPPTNPLESSCRDAEGQIK